MIIKTKAELKIKSALLYMDNLEVAFFGIVNQVNPFNYELEDVLFPPQQNKTTFVETKDSEFPKWWYDNIISKGIVSKIKMFGHSHPRFGTNPSGYDVNQFMDISKEISTYYIQFIINTKLATFNRVHDFENDRLIDLVTEFESGKETETILEKVVEKFVYSYIPKTTTVSTTKTVNGIVYEPYIPPNRIHELPQETLFDFVDEYDVYDPFKEYDDYLDSLERGIDIEFE